MKVDVNWVTDVNDGRIAIMPRPRGNDWLEDEIAAWQREGVDVIVSLLQPFEAVGLGLEKEKTACEAVGMIFVNFPIVDRQVPSSKSATRELVKRLTQFLRAGKNVAVHCRMGIGRSALISASVLAANGITVENAFSLIASARGVEVPDTPEQVEWVKSL